MSVSVNVSNGFVPTREENSVSYDVKSSESVTVAKNSRRTVSTGLTFVMPSPSLMYARITTPFQLSDNHGVMVTGNVVDTSLSQELKLVVFNTSDTDFVINRGDVVANLIFEQCGFPTLK